MRATKPLLRKALTKPKKNSKEEGFTFIEILVAMIILLILIGSVGFGYMRYVSQARVVAAKNQIQNFSMAFHAYFIENDTYPTTEQGLQALWGQPPVHSSISHSE